MGRRNIGREGFTGRTRQPRRIHRYNRKRWREALDDDDDDKKEYRGTRFLTGTRLLFVASSESNEMWAFRVVAGDPVNADVNKYAINAVEPFMTSSSNSVASTTI